MKKKLFLLGMLGVLSGVCPSFAMSPENQQPILRKVQIKRNIPLVFRKNKKTNTPLLSRYFDFKEKEIKSVVYKTKREESYLGTIYDKLSQYERMEHEVSSMQKTGLKDQDLQELRDFQKYLTEKKEKWIKKRDIAIKPFLEFLGEYK